MALDKDRLVSMFNGVFLLQNMPSAERYEGGRQRPAAGSGSLSHTGALLFLLCPPKSQLLLLQLRDSRIFASLLSASRESVGGKTALECIYYDVTLTK